MVLTAYFVLSSGSGFLAAVIGGEYFRQFDTSVEVSVACFPTFVRTRGPTDTNFGKPRATATFDSSAAYDFEVPASNRGKLRRNFKIGGTGTTRLHRPRTNTFVRGEIRVHRFPRSTFVTIAIRPQEKAGYESQ
jgi:hypothetical protein